MYPFKKTFMKHIIKSFVLLLFAFNTNPLVAQNNAINFTLESDYIHSTTDIIATSSVFSKNGDVLTWIQTKNAVSDTTLFPITSATENWNQSTSEGHITLNMTYQNYQCRLILSNQESGLQAILTFDVNGTEETEYSFDINTISYQ